MFQFPAFASLPLCIQGKIPYYRYLETTAAQSLCVAGLIFQAFKVGFPIRKSTDQRVFAAPHGLSQRITSFIACACQGIHQLPLRHLIVLIANAHPAQSEGLSLATCGSARQSEMRLNDPVRDSSSMSLAQKDQLLEICPRARSGNPSYAERLSVSRDKSQTFSAHEVRTNLLFTMSYRTGGRAKKLAANLYTNDLPIGLHLYSTPLILRSTPGNGGAGRDRTDDILLAKQVLSQLSYGP